MSSITASPITDVSFDPWSAAPDPVGPSTQLEAGRVCFQNANYRVSVGDDDTVHILNLRSGEQYLAWAPAQLWLGGDAVFDFWGTTTLELEDGTKITIHTSPWADDPLVTVSDKVTITQQDYGVEVFGMASRELGDLRFIETLRYGWLLDAVVADGNVIVENTEGAGFVGNNVDGLWQEVDQAYLEATDLAQLGELAGERGAALLSLSSLLAVTFVGAFRGPLAYRFAEHDDGPAPPEREPSAFTLRLERDRLARWHWGAP